MKTVGFYSTSNLRHFEDHCLLECDTLYFGRQIPDYTHNIPENTFMVTAVSLSHPLWFYGPFGPWPLFSFLILYTVCRIPWKGISASQGRYLHTEQHKHKINALRQPCLRWDSNPRPQCSSCRRWFMQWTARPL
jgi:hypothetical protein